MVTSSHMNSWRISFPIPSWSLRVSHGSWRVLLHITCQIFRCLAQKNHWNNRGLQALQTQDEGGIQTWHKNANPEMYRIRPKKAFCPKWNSTWEEWTVFWMRTSIQSPLERLSTQFNNWRSSSTWSESIPKWTNVQLLRTTPSSKIWFSPWGTRSNRKRRSTAMKGSRFCKMPLTKLWTKNRILQPTHTRWLISPFRDHWRSKVDFSWRLKINLSKRSRLNFKRIWRQRSRNK